MVTYYQLFDLESGNLVAEFDQEDGAWEALRSLEPDELLRLGLVRLDGEDVTLVALAAELVWRVQGNVVPFAASEPVKRKA